MIEVDSVTQSCGSDTSTLSYAHTCSGSNGLLVVGVTLKYASHITSTSATYNSVSMTKSVSRGNTTSQGNGTIIFTLKSPATGSNTVAISGDAGEYISSGAISLKGVDQTTPVEATASAVNGSVNDTPTVSITTQSSDSLVIDCVSYGNSITTGSGQTDRWKQESCSYYGAGSSESKATAGAVTMDWTTGTNNWWGISAIAVKELASEEYSETLTSTLSLNGSTSEQRGFPITITSTLNLNGVVTKTTTFAKTITSVLSLNGVVTKTANFAETLTSIISLKGVVSKTQSRILTIASKLTLKSIISTVGPAWERLKKHTNTWTGETKHNTTWTGETKHTTDWTGETKHNTTWTGETKHTTDWTGETKH